MCKTLKSTLRLTWARELTHPRTKPMMALWYLVNKYVHAFEPCGNVPAAFKMPDGDLAAELKAFMGPARRQDDVCFVPRQARGG